MAKKAPPPKGGIPTIKDIAAHLGISHSTVSRALNDHRHTNRETKEKVLKAAATLGYVPHSGARTMRQSRNNLLGLIIPDVQNDAYTAIAKAMAESCARVGYELILGVSEDDPALEWQHIRGLQEARGEGVLIVPTANPDRRTVAATRQIATVQVVRSHAALIADAITIDDEAGTFAATSHLQELGHRRIAFVGGREVLSTGTNRLAGYRKAIERRRGAATDALVELGDPRPLFGRQAVLGLLSRRKQPTAIVLASSQLTIGALEALHQLNVRVPHDLSMVAYGDPDWFKLWGPGITTVGLPLPQIANAAVESLLGRIGDSNDRSLLAKPVHVRFQPHLIIRGSAIPLGSRRRAQDQFRSPRVQR